MRYSVYILHCANGSLYTGYTSDLVRRMREHFSGSAKCKYTRSFKPLNVAQCWQVKGDKALAMKVERFIKKLNKEEKQQLMMDPHLLARFFPCEPIKLAINK